MILDIILYRYVYILLLLYNVILDIVLQGCATITSLLLLSRTGCYYAHAPKAKRSGVVRILRPSPALVVAAMTQLRGCIGMVTCLIILFCIFEVKSYTTP